MRGNGNDEKKLILLLLVLIGMPLPFAANIIGGIVNGFSPGQYIFQHNSFVVNIGGILFLSGFNAIAIGVAFASFLMLENCHIILRWLPTIAGYVLLTVLHFHLNLSSDAQAAIAVVFIRFWPHF
jgi:hypothetical protein